MSTPGGNSTSRCLRRIEEVIRLRRLGASFLFTHLPNGEGESTALVAELAVPVSALWLDRSRRAFPQGNATTISAKPMQKKCRRFVIRIFQELP
jgi:hypothetical protein